MAPCLWCISYTQALLTYSTCFQLKKLPGLWSSAEYSSFSVGPEADKYRLNITGYSGDAGDALNSTPGVLRRVNGMQFSTPYQDNDMSGAQCGKGKAAGWFRNCGTSTIIRDSNGCWNAWDTTSPKIVTDARMLVKLD